LAERRKMTHQK
jgi:hypothetical protein